jgi:hypothetical protein
MKALICVSSTPSTQASSKLQEPTSSRAASSSCVQCRTAPPHTTTISKTSHTNQSIVQSECLTVSQTHAQLRRTVRVGNTPQRKAHTWHHTAAGAASSCTQTAQQLRTPGPAGHCCSCHSDRAGPPWLGSAAATTAGTGTSWSAPCSCIVPSRAAYRCTQLKCTIAASQLLLLSATLAADTAAAAALSSRPLSHAPANNRTAEQKQQQRSKVNRKPPQPTTASSRSMQTTLSVSHTEPGLHSAQHHVSVKPGV